MMSSATLTLLTLLLIAQQALSRPSDSADKEAIPQLPPGYDLSKGFLTNLLGSSGAAGSQNPNKTGGGSQKPNKPGGGKQSATIISATTYPEGSKPANASKPATGQEKPSETPSQNKPVATPTPSVPPSPPAQSKPPGSSMNGEYLSSLFGLPGAVGSQKPNKPPVSFGSGAYPFGSPYLGSSIFGSSPGSSATFPGYMAGFMQPPQAGYMQGYMSPPPPPMLLNSLFSGVASPFGGLNSPLGGLGSLFGGLGSPFGSDASFVSQTGPGTFLQGGNKGNGFALPSWLLDRLMRSIETSQPELYLN